MQGKTLLDESEVSKFLRLLNDSTLQVRNEVNRTIFAKEIHGKFEGNNIKSWIKYAIFKIMWILPAC